MKHEELRQAVARTNKLLASSGLVKWTSGNASGRDRHSGDVVIKPSGVPFDELNAETMVVLDRDGQVLEGKLKPSVDSASHLYVYRQRPEIGGIVHTHSKYATAFAVAGLNLPVTTTTHACLFGGEIPCSGLIEIGEEQIGKAIVEEIGDAQAILMRSHGVFAIGADTNVALKNAVYVEESAEASFLAHSLGAKLKSLDDTFISACRKMYLNDYGQTRP